MLRKSGSSQVGRFAWALVCAASLAWACDNTTSPGTNSTISSTIASTTTTVAATTTVATTTSTVASSTSTVASTTTSTVAPTANFTVTPTEASTADCNVKQSGSNNTLRCTFTASVSPASITMNSFDWRFGSAGGQQLGTVNPLTNPVLSGCGIAVNVAAPIPIVLTMNTSAGQLQVTKNVNFVKNASC